MDQIGKYEILDKIGSGGFAVVYKGYDPFIKRPVAIKVCYSRDEETRKRFHREAEIAGRLVHRHITTVYDFGIHEHMPYLVEEYLSGEDLAHMIRRGEPEEMEQKIDCLVQIASGLEYAHSQGVIHRDIKPSNIRILDNGRVKIMDFGTAKMANVESNLTQTGMTLGTVAYLSPERLLGQDTGSAQSDIFSLGVLAYELLSFRRPFPGRSIPNLIDQVLNAAPVPLTDSWPECPPTLADVVHRCLQKDPSDRFVSCEAMIGDLDEFRVATTSPTQIVIPEQDPRVTTVAMQADGLLDRARQQISRGKIARAEMLLEEVLEVDPANVEARSLLGDLQVETAEAVSPAQSQVFAPEDPSMRRERKIAEATHSIENYITHRELGQAASALKFATQLLGDFEKAGMLRDQLVGTLRADLVALKSAGMRQGEGDLRPDGRPPRSPAHAACRGRTSERVGLRARSRASGGGRSDLAKAPGRRAEEEPRQRGRRPGTQAGRGRRVDREAAFRRQPCHGRESARLRRPSARRVRSDSGVADPDRRSSAPGRELTPARASG